VYLWVDWIYFNARSDAAKQCILVIIEIWMAETRQDAYMAFNPIESTFATVRLRTVKTRGCVSRDAILAMVYKLGESAAKRWQRLRGYRRLPELIQGVRFRDGIAENSTSQQAA